VNLTQSEIKYLRSLQQKKFREAEQKFLLEGWRPLYDALNSDYCLELIAILPEIIKNNEHQSLLALAKKRNILIKELKEVQLNQISDTVNSQGVIALVHQQKELLEAKHLQKAKLIVACDRISDPGNLGTILRTCDWFGLDTVLLNNGCVSMYNEKVIRATAGSIFHLKVFENLEFELLFPSLKSNGFRLVSTAMEGKPIFSFESKERDVIILGSEAHGVDTKLMQDSDELLNIPRFGKAESLNVGVACGIILAHYRKG
jgi:RNA methyltransferase, TrmH family